MSSAFLKIIENFRIFFSFFAEFGCFKRALEIKVA